MKHLKYTFLLTAFFLPSLTYSQSDHQIKKIEVIGTSEMEVTPDEIYVRITLKEYQDGRRKVDLDKLEKGLVNALKREDIPSKNLTVQNIYGYNWDWKKQKAKDFLATKSFRLKVPTLKKMNDVIERLDERGVHDMNVDDYRHSQMEEYKKELKLKALQNAKEKAQYLLGGIDEQIGGVLEVYEMDSGPQPPVMYRAEVMQEARMADYESNVEFRTMKLEAQVRAVFSIQ